MKRFFLLLLGVCSLTALCAAKENRFYTELRKRVAKWEDSALRKSCTDAAFVERFEFFVWSEDFDQLTWYVINVETNVETSKDRPTKATMRWGIGESEKTPKISRSQGTDYALSEIAKSELFNLPTFLPKTQIPYIIFTYTGASYFLGRRTNDGGTTEVFRWVGESNPVDKVIDTLEEMAKTAQRP